MSPTWGVVVVHGQRNLFHVSDALSGGDNNNNDDGENDNRVAREQVILPLGRTDGRSSASPLLLGTQFGENFGADGEFRGGAKKSQLLPLFEALFALKVLICVAQSLQFDATTSHDAENSLKGFFAGIALALHNSPRKRTGENRKMSPQRLSDRHSFDAIKVYNLYSTRS